MRNLKKVLALVLVVATLASICMVGASAAYSEETKYPEAAAVVKALGIIEGYDDGTMQYDKAVTREEAAKIICYALLGKTGAEALKTGTAPFADVAANRWSAGFIAYLKEKGVIDGVSDTEFAPTAGVTGIAFAKMLLAAVGYGAKGEFDGGAWDINTITLANENKIYTGTKAADLTVAATREECMLYAFNTIVSAPVVKYNSTFDTYYWGLNVLDTTTARENCTLAKTKFNMTSVSSVDGFGRPTVDYSLNGVVVAKNVQAVAPTYTFDNLLQGKALYAKLGAVAAAKVTTINQYVDGASTPATYTPATVLTATDTTVIAGQGAKTEVYASVDGTTLTLVTVYEHIAKVSAIDTKTGVVTLDSTDKGIIAGVALNDYVVYTKDASITDAQQNATTAPLYRVVKAAKATPTVATFKYTNAFGQYVFDGTAYSSAAQAVGAAPAVYETQYNLYTDSLGNLLMATAVDTTVRSNDYLYLIDSFTKAEIEATELGVTTTTVPASAKMKVVYASGGIATVNYPISTKVVAGNTEYYIALPGGTPTEVVDGKVAAAGWYSYIVNEAGEVTLVAAVPAANVTSNLKVNTGKFDVLGAPVTAGVAAKADSKTVLNVVAADGTVTTYTGIAQFPNMAAAQPYAVMFTTDLSGSTLTTINAYDVAGSGIATPDTIYGYNTGLTKTDILGKHYNFYINGAVVDVVVPAAAPQPTAKTFYEMTLDSTGYHFGAVATDVDTYDTYNPATGIYDNAHTISKVDDQYFLLKDNDALYYNAKTVVYDLAANGAAGTLAAGRAIAYIKDANGVATHVWMY